MRKLAFILAITILFTTTAVAQSNSQIELEIRETEPVPLQSSEYGTVWLQATNTGGSEASNVNISFNENYPFQVVRGDQSSWNIGSLSPGERYQMRLDVLVDDNAVQGNNSLDFTVDTSSLTYTQSIPVEVRADNNILAVSDVNFTEHIAPGETREMTLTLENLADAQLKNVEAQLNIADETPVAVLGASTKTLTNINAQDEVELDYEIIADSSADTGVYKLPLELTYENKAGTEFTKQTNVGISIGGLPQLETGLNSENPVSQGSTETLTLRLVNRGEGQARFTQMTVMDGEGYSLITPETTYIGDMGSDDFQTAEYRISVDSDAESLTMPVELEYTTEDGEETRTQEIEVEVYSQQELQQLGLQQGSIVLPAAIALILVLAVVLYWRRRRKRNS